MIFGLLLLLASTGAQAAAIDDIGLEVCKYIVAYQQEPGVEYEPGKDVHGKPVVEADLEPSPVKVPEKFSFDITVDTAEYLGMDTPKGLEGKAVMGTVSYDKGKLFFNGKPMEGDAVTAMREACTPKPTLQKNEKPRYNQ